MNKQELIDKYEKELEIWQKDKGFSEKFRQYKIATIALFIKELKSLPTLGDNTGRYCKCIIAMIQTNQETQSQYCFFCKEEINHLKQLPNKSEEDAIRKFMAHTQKLGLTDWSTNWDKSEWFKLYINRMQDQPKEVSFENVKDVIKEFSDRKFGKERPFTAPLHHLSKEVKEAIQSGDIYEFADMLLLLLDAYRKRFPELSTSTLLEACIQKLSICEGREWGKPDKDGVIEHIRTTEINEPKEEKACHAKHEIFMNCEGSPLTNSNKCKGCDNYKPKTK